MGRTGGRVVVVHGSCVVDGLHGQTTRERQGWKVQVAMARWYRQVTNHPPTHHQRDARRTTHDKNADRKPHQTEIFQVVVVVVINHPPHPKKTETTKTLTNPLVLVLVLRPSSLAGLQDRRTRHHLRRPHPRRLRVRDLVRKDPLTHFGG
jgi:hypothetical protein